MVHAEASDPPPLILPRGIFGNTIGVDVIVDIRSQFGSRRCDLAHTAVISITLRDFEACPPGRSEGRAAPPGIERAALALISSGSLCPPTSVSSSISTRRLPLLISFPACGVAGVTSREYRFASDSSLSRQAQKIQLWGRFGAFATPRQMTALCRSRPWTPQLGGKRALRIARKDRSPDESRNSLTRPK
jgi:hypothetical protein